MRQEGKETSPTTTTTTTLTIAEVLAEHRSSRHRKRKRKHEQQQQPKDQPYCVGDRHRLPIIPAPAPVPMDLAAVMLSMTLDYETKIISVIIGDDSISGHECARIFFKFNLNNSVVSQWLEMKKGDVIRFNNVLVKKDYQVEVEEEVGKVSGRNSGTNGHNNVNAGTGTGTAGITPQKLSTVICDLSSNDWRTPEAGTCFCRISKMLPHSFGHFVMEPIQCTSMSTPMMTSQHVVENILIWFRKYHMNMSMNIDKSTNLEYQYGYSHGENVMYKRRKIKDLQSQGILSDVIVCVQSLAQQKDKFQLFNSRSTCSAQDVYAILSEHNITSAGGEDNDSIPLFYNCKSNLHIQLKNAFEKQYSILLSKVLTQRKSSSMYFRQKYNIDNEFEYIIVPTPGTSITTITSMHNENDRFSLSQSFLSQGSTNSIGTNNLTESEGQIVQSRCDDFSSHNDEGLETLTRSATSNESSYRNAIIRAQIKSIYFEQLDAKLAIDQKSWPSSDLEFFQILLIQNNDPAEIASASSERVPVPTAVTYRPSIITIETITEGQENQSYVIHADTKIMSTLCGNYNPMSLTEIVENKTQNNDKKNRNRLLVRNLLRGLVCLDIIMEWSLKIEKEKGGGGDKIFVEDVHLTSL